MDGKVVFSAPFRGYKNLVIINHGRGSFSVYGNLEEVYVHENDHIDQQGLIGIVAFDIERNASLFYFETRFNKKAVNPVKWLRKPHWKKPHWKK